MEEQFAAPIEKRRERWLIELGKVVNQLCDRVDDLTPEKLFASEPFVSLALTASRIALRSHQEDKLAELRNAVLNSMAASAPSEDKQFILLRLVDELTPTHIQALAAARVRTNERHDSYERRIYLLMPELGESHSSGRL
jgi:hypothetical protein